MNQTYVVDEEKVGCSEPKGEPCAKRHTPLLDDPRWHGRFVLLPNLDDYEDYEEEACKHQEHNDPSVTPRVPRSAPLKPNQEAYDCG